MHYNSMGKLTQEQKEQTWATTISGSQAWKVLNEPFNLIREKLGIENIHESKYDFFNDNKKMKAVGANAMANGTHYESWIMSEVVRHVPGMVSEDITYHPVYPEGHRMKPFETFITATPDGLLFDGDLVEVLSELKASTSAADRMVMNSRYYGQLLHNSYVMRPTQETQLWTKNELTVPINKYLYIFNETDYLAYEDTLYTFFTNWSNQIVDAYDSVAPAINIAEDTDPVITDLFLGEDLDSIVGAYQEAKVQGKATTSIINKFEKKLKENWFNSKEIIVNDSIVTLKVTQSSDSLDTKAALDGLMRDYNVPHQYLDSFMKESFRKSITIKPQEKKAK